MLIVPSGYGRGRRRKATREARGTKMPRSIEARYDRALRAAVKVVLESRTKQLVGRYEETRDIPAIQQFAQLLADESAILLQRAATVIVPDWFGQVELYTAEKFNASIRSVLGVDAQSVLQQDIYNTIRNEVIPANVGYIRNLSAEHYLEVERALLADFQGLPYPGTAKSLAGRVQDILGSTRKRASVIARDQTAKLNGDMVQARQEDAGITHYVWRTAGDQRVVGTPGGLYPKGNRLHGNHYERNGKVFAWNDPPEDGHAGKSLQCRCVSSAVINQEKLNVQEVSPSLFDT